jgi:hypothetical protein
LLERCVRVNELVEPIEAVVSELGGIAARVFEGCQQTIIGVSPGIVDGAGGIRFGHEAIERIIRVRVGATLGIGDRLQTIRSIVNNIRRVGRRVSHGLQLIVQRVGEAPVLPGVQGVASLALSRGQVAVVVIAR